MTKTIQEWADDVGHVVEFIERLPHVLKDLEAVPAGGTPDERLAAVVALFRRLRLETTNKSMKPGAALAERVAFACSSSHGAVGGSMRNLLANAYWAANDALMAGGAHAELVHTAEFGTLAYVPVPGESGTEVPLALGVVASLPPGHPLRSALPPGDYYVAGEQGPALVLGVCGKGAWPNGAPTPAAFYDLPTSLAATRAWRRTQRDALEQARQAEEQKSAERLALTSNNPANEVLRLRQRVKELEAAQARAAASTPPA